MVLFQGIYSKHGEVGRESSSGFDVGHSKQRLPMVWGCGEDEMGRRVRYCRAGDRGKRHSLGTLQLVQLLCSKLGYNLSSPTWLWLLSVSGSFLIQAAVTS